MALRWMERRNANGKIVSEQRRNLSRTREIYVKMALIELATEFRTMADSLERGQRKNVRSFEMRGAHRGLFPQVPRNG